MTKRGYVGDDEDDDDFLLLTPKKKAALVNTSIDYDRDSILPPTMEASMEPTMMLPGDKVDDILDSREGALLPTIAGALKDELPPTQDPGEDYKENKQVGSTLIDLETQALPGTLKPETHYPELETMAPQMQSSRFLCLDTLPESRAVQISDTCALNLDSQSEEPAIKEVSDPLGGSSPELKPISKKSRKKVTFVEEETAVEKYEKIRGTMTQQVLPSLRETVQPTFSEESPQIDFQQAAIEYRIQCAILRHKIRALTEGKKS